jgi:archaemetzincin
MKFYCTLSSRIIVSLFVLILFSFTQKAANAKHDAGKLLIVQPFNDLPDQQLNYVVKKLRAIIPSIQVAPRKALPQLAWYKPRNRYRADSLIHWLGRNTTGDNVTIGLTSKDISATKGNVRDFGIMGLGFRPGNACVASSFRLSKNNNSEELFKVAIHELGHTQGLDHCPVKYCFMRDAEGKNTTGEEKEFCSDCKQKLISRGWKL